MRILHLTNSIGPHAAGLGRIALSLTRAQRALGHDAQIWTHDPPSVASVAAEEEGLCAAVSAFPVLGPSIPGFSPTARRRARSALFDLVHQHGIWTAQAQISAVFRARRIPTVVAPQGALEAWTMRRSRWKKRLALLFYESRNLREASCLQATNVEELATFRQLGLSGPIAVIPNGVETVWMQTAGDGDSFRGMHLLPRDRRIILFVSRIHPKKGLPLLIEAAAALLEELDGWLMVIAGPDEGEHRSEVERLVRDRGLAGMVRFVGAVHGQAKRDAFAAADLLVLPTLSDNFAIVVAEALGARLPVITTRAVPWQELEERGAGWWVAPDVEHLRDALSAAVKRTSPELAEMGQRGFELVRERYLWERIASDALDLYSWLNGSSSRPSFVAPAEGDHTTAAFGV